MSNWKETIARKFSNHSARREEIHNSLYAILQDLSCEESIEKVELNVESEYPLVWEISINGRKETIGESDVETAQKGYNFNSQLQFSENKKDIMEALQDLLVQKFK
ncbi:hypothetical protein D3P09_03250 [Paenibacillus pinisoli]|uniref:Uncharacterized protein n=1 Tax=Paenibacillus pinisoli TaxID=1276110 RepID=A0A3A6PGV9_9BACL|nr:hypothetical protein [Paenibacillus pinisoli]RJX41042.1 hypothetical protein D3P09_03250 [Paenibacillus pinisoli]